MSNLKPTGHVQPRTASNVLCSQLPYYHGGSSSRPSGWPSPRHSPITQQQLDISPIQYFFTHCRPGKSKDWIPMTGHGSSDAFSVVLISVDREWGKPIEKFVKKKKKRSWEKQKALFLSAVVFQAILTSNLHSNTFHNSTWKHNRHSTQLLSFWFY